MATKKINTNALMKNFIPDVPLEDEQKSRNDNTLTSQKKLTDTNLNLKVETSMKENIESKEPTRPVAFLICYYRLLCHKKNL